MKLLDPRPWSRVRSKDYFDETDFGRRRAQTLPFPHLHLPLLPSSVHGSTSIRRSVHRKDVLVDGPKKGVVPTLDAGQGVDCRRAKCARAETGPDPRHGTLPLQSPPHPGNPLVVPLREGDPPETETSSRGPERPVLKFVRTGTKYLRLAFRLQGRDTEGRRYT